MPTAQGDFRGNIGDLRLPPRAVGTTTPVETLHATSQCNIWAQRCTVPIPTNDNSLRLQVSPKRTPREAANAATYLSFASGRNILLRFSVSLRLPK